MVGWHTRYWRRMRVAPGLTVNFSKSGASLSVGPRGAKVTVGRRGVRQTVGIPGTGFFATRQLSGQAPPAAEAPVPGAEPDAPAPTEVAVAATAAAAPPADDQVVLYFGLATVVGVLFGLALLIIGLPSGQAIVGGALAVATGIAYEGLAHHHPGPAKALAAVVVGVVSIAAVAAAVFVLAMFAAALGGMGSSGRSRRR